MTQKKGRATMLCRPKDAYLTDEDMIPDSETRWCEMCGCEVWIAPSSLQIMEERSDEFTFEIFCTPCGEGVMLASKDAQVELPTQRQRDELKRLGVTDKELIRVLAFVQRQNREMNRRRNQ